MSDLKAAILRRRGVPSPYQDEGPLSVVVKKVAEQLIEQHLANLHDELLQQVKDMIEEAVKSLLPEALKGDPGADAEVDMDEVCETISNDLQNNPKFLRAVTQYLKADLLEADQTKDTQQLVDFARKLKAEILAEDEKKDAQMLEAFGRQLKEEILSLDATTDAEEKIQEEKTEEKPKLRISDIVGLEPFLQNLNRSIRESKGGKMIHGGGDTVDAGTGVTLTRVGGRTRIDATGGVGTVYTETPSGLINGSNKAYSTLHSIDGVYVLAINGQELLPSEYTVLAGSHFTLTTALNASLNGTSFTISYYSNGSQVFTETPSGLINSANTTYTTLNGITHVLSLFINGEFIHPSEYSVSGNGFTMNSQLDASLAGTTFTIKYV